MSENDRGAKLAYTNKVYETTDYSKFRFLKINRDIDDNHVKVMMKKITTRGYIRDFPVKVNANLDIIDGQHRFMACKNLGLPVYYVYVLDFGKKDIEDINTLVKKWRNTDFMKKHAASGNVNYIKLSALIDETTCPCNILLTIIRQVCGDVEDSETKIKIYDKHNFNEGLFIYPDAFDSKIRQRLRIVYDLSMYTTKPKKYDRELVYAVDAMISTGKYNHSVMVKKLKTSKKVPVYGKKLNLIKQFQLIFNFRAADDEKVILMPVDLAMQVAMA